MEHLDGGTVASALQQTTFTEPQIAFIADQVCLFKFLELIIIIYKM
jgi:hypothetical protein